MTSLDTIATLPLPTGELREADRSALLLRVAKLICQSGEYVCLVRDVSWTGLRLRLFHALPDERFVFLQLAQLINQHLFADAGYGTLQHAEPVTLFTYSIYN